MKKKLERTIISNPRRFGLSSLAKKARKIRGLLNSHRSLKF